MGANTLGLASVLTLLYCLCPDRKHFMSHFYGKSKPSIQILEQNLLDHK